MRWLRKLLGRGERLQRVDYEMGNLKAAEEAIIADLLAGRVRVHHSSSNHVSHRQEDWRASNASLHHEVDYPSMMVGTFSYLYVHGRDLMSHDPAEFDGRRVAHVMRHGSDPGPQPRNTSLYFM